MSSLWLQVLFPVKCLYQNQTESKTGEIIRCYLLLALKKVCQENILVMQFSPVSFLLSKLVQIVAGHLIAVAVFDQFFSSDFFVRMLLFEFF